MTDFNTDDNVNDGITQPVDLDFDVSDDDLQAAASEGDDSGDEFNVEEAEVETPEGFTPPVATGTVKPKVKKAEEEIDPSEFLFDATPKPRQPKDPNAPEKPAGAKRSKDPLPDGWVTPSTLVKILRDERIVNIRPQAAFGFAKNGRDFPVINHTDGRYICPLEDGATYIVVETDEETGETREVEKTFEKGAKTWVIEHFEKKAKRDAERAAAANNAQAAANAAASEDASTTPEVGGEGQMASVES